MQPTVMPELIKIVRRLADDDPYDHNPDEGDSCHYCGQARNHSHETDCLQRVAFKLIIQLDKEL